MYDTGKVVVGLFIFVGIITIPAWQSISNDKAAAAPVLEVPTKSKTCIESTEFMAANHVKLLEEWEISAVRNGIWTYTATDNQVYTISFSTCFTCHDKETFCDSCHNYVGVKPSCWSCHSVPNEEQK